MLEAMNVKVKVENKDVFVPMVSIESLLRTLDALEDSVLKDCKFGRLDVKDHDLSAVVLDRFGKLVNQHLVELNKHIPSGDDKK